MDPRWVYRLALSVLAMGGASSADIAQEVPEALLRDSGALLQSEQLVYGHRLPCGAVMCGVYLDDFAVAAVLPTCVARDPFGPDKDRVQQILDTYDRLNIPVASENGFGFVVERPSTASPTARCMVSSGRRRAARTSAAPAGAPGTTRGTPSSARPQRGCRPRRLWRSCPSRRLRRRRRGGGVGVASDSGYV